MDPDDKAGPAHEAEEAPTWALDSTNLADERLGSSVLFATDEWFARAECLLNPSPATYDHFAYCE
jgi:allantoicase